MQTVAELGEFGLIEYLSRTTEGGTGRAAGLELGIGDDAALLRPSAGTHLAVTCDVLLEGRHFLPRSLRGEPLGRRAMEVNLSDLAAMGSKPRFAFVSLGLRADTAVAEVAAWYRGFAAALAPWGAAVAGGNMTRVEGAQFIAITLLGEVLPGQALRRDGARPGDTILITGYPGQAAAGLCLLGGEEPVSENDLLVHAYLAPQARVAEGLALAEGSLASAAIDTSDGLLGDLGHLCAASGVGARLWADRLPVSPPLAAFAAHRQEDPLDWVLGPSDDYELVVTCSPEQTRAVVTCVEGFGKVSVHCAGVLTAGEGRLEVVGADGRPRAMAPAGWNHFSVGT